jgi:hypothetical protein
MCSGTCAKITEHPVMMRLGILSKLMDFDDLRHQIAHLMSTEMEGTFVRLRRVVSRILGTLTGEEELKTD